MLYWLGYEYLFHLYTPFRVFQYATFRTAMASLTALAMSILLGPWLIARLREFQIGQHIREDGPQSHQKKAGIAVPVVVNRVETEARRIENGGDPAGQNSRTT